MRNVRENCTIGDRVPRVANDLCIQSYILLMLEDKHRDPSDDDIKKPGNYPGFELD